MIQILDPRPLPTPIMPVDVAVRFCLAHSPPLAKFMNQYDDCRGKNLVTRYKPLRPCLSLKKESDSCSSDWTRAKTRSKKHVVFADTKGLALTAIHVFSDSVEEGVLDLPFDMIDLEDITAGLKLHEERNLILGFEQPSSDYLAFRNCLQKNFICLENCTLQERSIAGTVKVKNLSFTKKVQVRITYDSWNSFTDIDCAYMNNVYGGSNSDTFSFVIDLPPAIPTQDKIEFCVSFECEGQVFWDNNDGHNYKVVHAEWKSDGVQVPMPTQPVNMVTKRPFKPHRIDFDHFGSPKTSNGLFPELPMWGRLGNTAPYW